ADTGCDVFLFNVGVERVVQDADVGVIDLFAETHGVDRGVEEVSLEAVERLNGERDAVGGERIADRLQTFDGALPFVWGAAAAGEIADGAVHGSGENFRAGVG